MKKTFFAATALATALFAMGAQANDRAADNARVAQHSRIAAHMDLGTWDRAELRNGTSLEVLIGTDVRGRNGESIGEVQNVILTRDGRARSLVVSAGGIAGVGETFYRVPWQQAPLSGDRDHITVPIDSRNVERFRWGAENMRVGRGEILARDVMDSSVALRDGMRYGDIDDLIVGRDGRVKALVVGGALSSGAGHVAIPFRSKLTFNADAKRYRLPYSRDEVARLRPFDYSAAGIARPGVGVTGGSAGGFGGFFGLGEDERR